MWFSFIRSIVVHIIESLSFADQQTVAHKETKANRITHTAVNTHPELLVASTRYASRAGNVMPSSCPECGSSNVVEDDLYSQRQWVCVDCGSVVSEGHLTTSLSEETQGRGNPAQDTSLLTDLHSACMKTAALTSVSFVLSSCALSCFHRGVQATVSKSNCW